MDRTLRTPCTVLAGASSGPKSSRNWMHCMHCRCIQRAPGPPGGAGERGEKGGGGTLRCSLLRQVLGCGPPEVWVLRCAFFSPFLVFSFPSSLLPQELLPLRHVLLCCMMSMASQWRLDQDCPWLNASTQKRGDLKEKSCVSGWFSAVALLDHYMAATKALSSCPLLCFT